MNSPIPPLSLAPQPPAEPVPFVVENLLPLAYLTILAGEPKSGKTAFATALALAVATGQPFLGRRTKPGPVLWLSLEENPDERAAIYTHIPESVRLALHENPLEGMEPGQLPIFTLYDHAPIDTSNGIHSLEFLLSKLKPNLVVIDSLHAAHSGRSLADGWAARRTLKGLKRFSGEKAPAILVLHHLGGTRYRRRVAESAQLAATASMLWLIEELPAPEGTRRYKLESRGRGGFANQRLYLESPNPLDYHTVDAAPVEVVPEPKINPLDAMILDALRAGNLTASEIADRIGQHAGSIRNALTRLQKKGHIEVAAIISGARKYRFVTQKCNEKDESDESIRLANAEVTGPEEASVSSEH